MRPYQNFSHSPMSIILGGVEYIEDWKPVHGFEEYYLVSTFGRFLSLREDKIMRQHINDKGYLIISLKGRTRNEQFKFKSHRLVGIAFIPNPIIKPQINHENFDKLNNFYKNLTWVTGKENTEHYRRSRPPAKPPKEKVGENPIRCQKIVNNDTGEVFGTVYILSEQIGLTPKYIRKLLSGEVENKTPYRWVKGEYTLFYKKRYERDLVRFKELRKSIYGIDI